MPYRIISVPGGFTSTNTTRFGGTEDPDTNGPVWSSPNTLVSISGWQNWSTGNSAAVADMNKIYNEILANINSLDGVIVIGHSRGGQMQYKLFRERYSDLLANVDPARILFISSGNPERKYGGASVNNPAGDPASYPGASGGPYGVGYGLPPWGTGPFKMHDIVRQYDRFADYPNDINSDPALDMIFGEAPHGDVISNNGVHAEYTLDTPALNSNGYPADPTQWVSYQEGNVTYYTIPAYATTTVAPATFSAQVHGGAFTNHRFADIPWRDLAARNAVETAYQRPQLTLPRVR